MPQPTDTWEEEFREEFINKFSTQWHLAGYKTATDDVAWEMMADFAFEKMQKSLASQRTEIVRKIEEKKNWYSGEGNKPIRDVLEDIINSITESE